MKADLVMRALEDPGVGGLVGDAVSWSGRVRGDTLPALVLTMVSPGRDWAHDGPTGEDESRIQFDSYAATVDGADALAQAVRDMMEVPATVGTTRFEEGFLDAEQDFDEGEQDGGSPLFRISQDFIFLHSQI